MGQVPTISNGQLVPTSWLNNVADNLNGLTAQLVVTNVGMALGSGTAPGVVKAQFHIEGLGQTSASYADGGNLGGALYLGDSAGGAGNGGAVLFGASALQFAGIKGLLTNGAGNGVGDLVAMTRRTTASTTLAESMRWAVNGMVGVGATAPTFQLHVKGAGQATSALTDAGDRGGTLCLQDSAFAAGNGGALLFGSNQGHFAAFKGGLTNGGGNTVGWLAVSLRRDIGDTALTQVARFDTDGSFRLTSGTLYLGATSNANMTHGLTISQLSATNEIVALKADSSHAFTALTEATSFGTMTQYSAHNGGLVIRGFADTGTNVGLSLHGFGGGADTTESISSLGAVVIAGSKPGTLGSDDVLGTDGNVMVIRSANVTQFIFKNDGDGWLNGAGWTTYDGVDDVATLDLLTAYVTRENDPLKASFGEWLKQSREPLERLKLASFDEHGHPFVNMSKLTMLLTGAVRQLGTQVADLQSQLKELTA